MLPCIRRVPWFLGYTSCFRVFGVFRGSLVIGGKGEYRVADPLDLLLAGRRATARTAHGSPRGRTVANETLFSGISSNESPKLTRAEKSP